MPPFPLAPTRSMRTAHELFRRSVLVLALSAPAVSAARAQEAASAAATLPSAREIVDRYNEVTGTTAMLEKTKSSHVKGKMSMTAFNISGPLEIWSAKPNLRTMNIDLGEQGGLTRTGYDGSVGWAIQPMVGPKVLEGPELLQTKVEAEYDSSLKGSDLYESIETVGRENFEGKDCYKVEVVVKPLPGMDPEKTKPGRTSLEFYEVESGLLLGSTGLQVSDMGSMPYTAIASEYKKFGEQMVSTKSLLKVSGMELVITVESMEFDTVNPEVFALPPEIQKLAAAKSAPAPAKQ